jgi:Nickel responsive protein SCO4226-like
MEEHSMPKFMDVHTGMKGITPEALQAAHQADLDIQADEGVDFQRAWGDPESGMVWCVAEAPSADAVRRIHERAGHAPDEVYPVPVEV